MSLISSLIADTPGWPKPGAVFKNITPLLASPKDFRRAVDAITVSAPEAIDVVAGMEARGFIFATLVALTPGAGFVPVQEPGKLPRPAPSESFDLEYGIAILTMHADALVTGAHVFVVDDMPAIDDTVAVTAALLERLGAELVYVSVLLKLTALGDRGRLADQGISSCSAVLTS